VLSRTRKPDRTLAEAAPRIRVPRLDELMLCGCCPQLQIVSDGLTAVASAETRHRYMNGAWSRRYVFQFSEALYFPPSRDQRLKCFPKEALLRLPRQRPGFSRLF
jgi:hypothetical protein